MVSDEAQRYTAALLSDLPLRQTLALVRRHFTDLNTMTIATPRPRYAQRVRWLIERIGRKEAVLAPTLTEEHGSTAADTLSRLENQTNRPDRNDSRIKEIASTAASVCFAKSAPARHIADAFSGRPWHQISCHRGDRTVPKVTCPWPVGCR